MRGLLAARRMPCTGVRRVTCGRLNQSVGVVIVAKCDACTTDVGRKNPAVNSVGTRLLDDDLDACMSTVCDIFGSFAFRLVSLMLLYLMLCYPYLTYSLSVYTLKIFAFTPELVRGMKNMQ